MIQRIEEQEDADSGIDRGSRREGEHAGGVVANMTLRIYNTQSRPSNRSRRSSPASCGCTSAASRRTPRRTSVTPCPRSSSTSSSAISPIGDTPSGTSTNFTDIDDKIIARANREGISPDALTEQLIAEWHREMAALNVLPADVYPRATQEVDRIIAMIEELIGQGYAYECDGDVYYRVRAFEDYGKLSHRNLDDLLSGARIEIDERKEDPLDFALWKAAKPGEPWWESPWGPGRPGWHIECSAMCSHHLGGLVDIHGGGADLIFPHHENEIAQSEAALERSRSRATGCTTACSSSAARRCPSRSATWFRLTN